MFNILEGPEIHKHAEELNQFIGMTITEVHLFNNRFKRERNPVYAHGISLIGAQITRIRVKGNLIAFILSHNGKNFAALSSLGKTGRWVSGVTPLSNVRIKLILTNNNSNEMLCFVDQQNFGTFKIVSYIEMKRKLNELGPDIMATKNLWASITIPQFKARIARFGTGDSISEVLINQKIVAGGSERICKEALTLTGIPEDRLATDLNNTELFTIWDALHTIATQEIIV